MGKYLLDWLQSSIHQKTRGGPRPEVWAEYERMAKAEADQHPLLDELRELRGLVAIGAKLAAIAERPGEQDIEFDGSAYCAIEPETMDEMADLGTQFRRAAAALASQQGGAK